MAVPVHIIGGFLGAGKTTLIRHQLEARPGERVAVIVNDFGEAGLDELTLDTESSFQIQPIPGGCVCCTAPEGFVDALGAVLEGAPDRLVIEPTGLARPQDLVDTIRRSHHRDALALAPLVVVVDPARLSRADPEEQELVELQAAAADVLVANRTDLCDDEALERFDTWARDRWPEPLSVHHTSFGRLPQEALEWPAGEGARLPRAAVEPRAHDHASTDGYRTRSLFWSAEQIFSREQLSRAVLRGLAGLGGAPLVRFKGVFRTQEGFVRLDVAGGQLHEMRSGYRRDNRCDLIVSGEAETAEAALEIAAGWIAGAMLGENELRAQAEKLELTLPDGRVRVLDRQALSALPDGLPEVSVLFEKRRGAAALVGALFDSVELTRDGTAIVCAADGFASEPIPLRALCEGYLLHSQDGAPLPDKQGGPFRLLIPEAVEDAPSSCANVKAVTRIVVRNG